MLQGAKKAADPRDRLWTFGLVLVGEILGLGGAGGAGSLFSDLLYGVSAQRKP
jgi:hypothetical protein